nr:hypothetical protein [uncultured Desulfobacter sp.]
MRITDPQVIQDGEQDLIASVQKDLDLEAVKDLLKERLSASALSPKGGRIVVHDNDVAFRLDYEINLNGSLLFDREGNLIEDGQSAASIADTQADLQDEQLGEEDDMLALNVDENLSDDLPDYDDDDDSAEDTEEALTEALESEELSDDIDETDPGLEIDDLGDAVLFDQDESDDVKDEDIDELIGELTKDDKAIDPADDESTDLALEDEDTEPNEEEEDDDDDDDISDLLQENREFWEKKRE